MTHKSSRKRQLHGKGPHEDPLQTHAPEDAALNSSELIQELQDKLLALGQQVGTMPSAEIEKTAKAISTLITSVEKADTYLQASGHVAPGEGLSEPSRLDLLRKIKRMVENGILDELADEDDA